jgi:aromatic ring-cleaving dioxygenase
MDPLKRLDETVKGYHAHIYYTPETKPVAADIREEMGNLFTVTLGNWHDVPIGPHPAAMYQVAFDKETFPHLVPWLMLHRNGLSIMVHPLTGNDYDDHADFSLWLGPALQLRLDILRHDP